MSHDPAKRRKNLRKHGIDLPGCMEAFDGPVLTREDGPRLISCREAEPYEREAYYQAYPQI